MVCNKCRQTIMEGWNFCMFCGAKVSRDCNTAYSSKERELEEVKREIRRLEEELRLAEIQADIKTEKEKLEEIRRERKNEEQKLESLRRQREEEEKLLAYIVVKQRYCGILYDLSGPYDSYEEASDDYELYQSIWEDILEEDQYVEIVYK